jgi:protoporphyrinogen oxidase
MQRRLSMAIVGAGISGLTLAVNLLKHPLIKITVIEKEQRLGGRVFTEEVASNVYADLGANIIDF